jgi:membrane dipeptidase
VTASHVADPALRERARGVIDAALVWDNHACLPLRPADTGFLPQLQRCRAAGVDVVSVNVGFGPSDLPACIRNLAAFRRYLAGHPDEYVLVRSVADVDRARTSGRLAVTFDIEGMVPLDQGDHGLIAVFQELGVRWMLVAYNRNNAAGGGCHDDDCGLTAHGRAVIAEMKRVGVVVCCSHTGHRTAREVMDCADNPVIFSHSNPSAMTAHARNVPDDLIRACAATGGVVGINGVSFFIGTDADPAAAVARHIDHVAQCVGVEHVGISLDYVYDQAELLDALRTMRDTFPDPSAYAGAPRMLPPEGLVDVVAELCVRGYGDPELAAILGGNWRRVAEQVWR